VIDIFNILEWIMNIGKPLNYNIKEKLHKTEWSYAAYCMVMNKVSYDSYMYAQDTTWLSIANNTVYDL
jgi:hypothetical protein